MRDENKRKNTSRGNTRGDMQKNNTKTVASAQTQVYNTLAKTGSTRADKQKRKAEDSRLTNNSFLNKRMKSIENAFGTTGAAVASAFKDADENRSTEEKLKSNKTSLDDVAKQFGFESFDAAWDARDAAEAAGDTAKVKEIDEGFVPAVKKQSKVNADEMDKKVRDYSDYRQNNYISNKINQDRGKFAGSAINTLSTGVDVLMPAAGVALNTVQGGVEGVADELEENGLENFDIARAGQNALIGATTGAVAGGVNKGISSQLAKNGGNLFKGGNKLTRALNDAGSKTAVGRLGANLATGASRGAISGAVGGATGGGLGAALNNEDILQGVLQGASTGAREGAVMGGAMAGVNSLPGIKQTMNRLNQAGEDWNQRKQNGESFNERLTGTLTSGDSAVGEWLQGNRRSNMLGTVGEIGNRIIMEDGRPKPLYHGSPVKGIEEFDISKAGRNTRSGEKALFFTDDLPTADEFSYERIPTDDMFVDNRGAKGEVYTRNLDLENPLDLGKLTDTQIDELWDYAAPIAKMDGKEKFVKNMKDFSQAGNDQLIKSQLDLNLLRESPYDGIIAKMYPGQNDVREYGVFDTNKIINPESASVRQTPSTLSGWLKKAGQRAVEDINNTNLGNRIQDVSGDNYPQDIQNMRINDNMANIPEAETVATPSTANRTTPETEIYNRLMPQQEPIDLTDAFGDKGLGNIEQRNRLQAIGQQLQNAAQTQKFSGIYDSLDAKTAKRAAETNAPQKLAELGVRSQDYNEYAKTSSYVNRVVSDLAKKSGVKVNAPDLPTQLSPDNIDVIMSDSALKKYNGYVNKIVPDGDNPSQYSASYLLEKSRELGNKAANLRGNTDDVSALRQALTDAKYKLRGLATKALEGSEITGDGTNDMIANGLKKLGANEKVQDYYTEAVDGKAPSVADYIRRSSLFEQARDMGNQIDAEKYTRSASKQPTNPMTRIWRASGLDQPIETLLKNTIAPVASKATNLAGKAIEGAGNLGARMGGGDGGGNTTPQAQLPATVSNPNYNPATQLYNAIARTEGENQGEKQANFAGWNDAINRAQANKDQNLENFLGQMDTMYSGNELYEQLYGQPTTSEPVETVQEESLFNEYFPQTGDYWTDVLGIALQGAIKDQDMESFYELYDMYQDALSKTQKSSSSNKDYSNPANWASGDRTKLLEAQNGLSQIDQLEDAYNNAVGGSNGSSNAIQGWLRSRAADISGGNLDPSAANYNSQAQSVGMGIVKNMINLGVTEQDAKRYLQYLPALTDTREQANTKLAALRQAYQDQINNIYGLYGY